MDNKDLKATLCCSETVKTSTTQVFQCLMYNLFIVKILLVLT